MSGFVERLRSLRVAREEKEADRIRKEQEFEKERRQKKQEEQDKRLAELKEVFEAREFLKQHILPRLEAVNVEYLAGEGKIRYARAPEVPENWEEWLKKYGVKRVDGRFEGPSHDPKKISLTWEKNKEVHGLEIYFYGDRGVPGGLVIVEGNGESKLHGGWMSSWRPERLNPQEEGWLDKLEAKILEILEDPQKSKFPYIERETSMNFNYGG